MDSNGKPGKKKKKTPKRGKEKVVSRADAFLKRQSTCIILYTIGVCVLKYADRG